MPRVLTHYAVKLKKKKKYCLGYPGSSVIKNPPANAGDKSVIPEHAAEQPNLCIKTTEPVLESPGATTP